MCVCGGEGGGGGEIGDSSCNVFKPCPLQFELK